MRKRSRARHHRHHVRKTHAPKKKEFRGIDNAKDVEVILEKNKLLQDILGFSNDNLDSLFSDAHSLLLAHRNDEAMQAFILLSRINPFVPDFWLGLGLTHQANGDYQQALACFLVAETMDPARLDCYEYGIDCALEMKNFAQAEAILDQALRFANKHPQLNESEIIFKKAKRLAFRIQDEKRFRR